MPRITFSIVPTVLFAFIATTPLRAQTPDWGKILVPVYDSNSHAGAYGSRWASELWVRNEGTQPIRLLSPCFFECPPLTGIDLNPGESTTNFVLLQGGAPFPRPGGFLLTLPNAPETLRINLRIRDLSRQDLTWGTEIKTVKDDELLIGKISLFPVSTDDRFRVMLRMYTRDKGHAAQFRIRFYRLADNQHQDHAEPLLIETVVSGSSATEIDPGYVEIPAVVQAFPIIASHDLVRIEIEPIDPSTRYWAFVTVTNNETQHVTTVNP